MKGIKKIVSLITILFVIFFISSCNNTGLTTSVTVAARNTKLTIVATFEDENEAIFTDYTPYAYIYEMDGNKVGDQIDSSSFSLDDELSSGTTYITDELVFEDLSEETSYTIRITVTIDGKTKTLYNEVVSTSDLGSEENPIEITTVDEFLAIADDREAYYILMNDLDFEGVEVDPMFTTTAKQFEGGLDGNGYTISNFTITSNTQYNGLFGVNSGTIHDLTIENVSITSSRTSTMYTGLLVGYNIGVVDNITLNNCSVTATSTAYTLTYDQNIGGLVGYCGTANAVEVSVSNCTLNNVTITADVRHQANVGGLIGEVSLALSVRNAQLIENNYVNTTIEVNQEIRASIADAVDINVGGIIGFSAAAMNNCVAESDITVNTIKASTATYENGLTHYKVNVGGIAGATYNNVSRVVEDVAFIGSIYVDATEVYETRVGGIVGYVGNNFIFENAVVSITELTINGPEVEETEEDSESDEEETTETATYLVVYGLLFGTEIVDIDNEDYTEITDNNIIVYGSEGTTTITVEAYDEYLTNTYTIYSSDLTGFSDFVKSYLS